MSQLLHRDGPRISRKTWSRKVTFFLVFLVLFNGIQCASLLKRVTYKATDFTVFHNTSVLLGQGAGPQLYEGKDATTGWLRTIPPFGQMIFQPFSLLDIRLSAILWGATNLLLLGLSGATLFYFARRLDAKSRIFLAAVPILILILLSLSPGSIQVGQWSVLFTAFWIFFLGLSASRFRRVASAALAVPIGIKLYPVFLCGVFILQRRWAAFVISLGFVALTVALPTLVYGARTPALTQSFWQNAIVGPDSRVVESVAIGSGADQGIDAVGLRYLTSEPKFEARYPGYPNLALSKTSASRLINVFRLFVLVTTITIGFAVWKRLESSPLWGTVLLLSLLSAAQYLLLPGAKSRYAIYTFLAFVPLVLQCFAAKRLNHKVAYRRWCAIIVVCVVLTTVLIPDSLRLYGIGLIGPLLLWIFNIRFLLGLIKKPRVSQPLRA
jgi:hypothetical protein